MASFFGVTLTEPLSERIKAGATYVRLEEIRDANGCEPGRAIRLLEPRGDTLACGIADPENNIIHVLVHEPVLAFDRKFFTRRLERCLTLRRGLGLVDGVSCYRLVNGEGDLLSGFSVDIFGSYAVISAPSRPLLPFARLLAEAVLADRGSPALGTRGVVIKVRGKDPQDRTKDEVIGESPGEKIIAHELGVPYELHLLGALNVGLFPDMREQRRTMGRFVEGRRVLNTFAYTGALSVTAARLGATSVTSVDLSSGVLAWARENFRLSGFDTNQEHFRFEVSDVRRFLQKELDRGAEYDTIILDPPTVSAARASQWSMKKDYPALISLAARLLPQQGGILWVSANTRKGSGVMHHVALGLQLAKRRGSILEQGGLPPDFPTPVDSIESRYLDICQLFVTAE